MSAYKNFVQDFPKRCGSLLSGFEKQAVYNNCEVTLLLAVATTGLIVPYERLSKKAHPSQDVERFAAAREKLNIELEKKCSESGIWRVFCEDDWRYKKLDCLQGNPDEWGLDRDTKGITQKKSTTILNILRNALAHGNIWTMGNPEISTLVFVSLASSKQPNGPFKCLQCSPTVFSKFIKNWINFLGEVKVPGNLFVEAHSYEEQAA